MIGYIVRTGARLQPFGDPIGEVRLLDRPLEAHQRAVLARFCDRVEVIDSPAGATAEQAVLVDDHLYFTWQFLRRALRAARGSGRSALRFALAESRFLREKAPLGALDLREGPAAAGAGEVAGAHAPLPLLWWSARPKPGDLPSLPLCAVKIAERTFVPKNLRLLRDDLTLTYSITSEGVLSLRHWSHLLDANQVALASHWLDFSVGRVLWLAWRALTAFSLDKHLVAQRINRIGRGCDIHPTAFVAGSVLCDGARVGPQSVVFGSWLGEGAQVEGQSEVSLSVLGERSVVSFHTKLTASVLYPMSLASYPAAQMCLLGRRALHMGGSFPIDMKLTRGDLLDVKVRHEGKLVDSGKKFLGVCLGHGAIVGTGLWLQSGLEVPNEYTLVRDRASLVTRIPDAKPGEVLSLQEGELRPYRRG
jgi:hypothetical protein